MASVLSNKRQINDENKYRSKQAFARTHSVKKQIFGELKNVIHNQQGGITPFKGTFASNGALSVSKKSAPKIENKNKIGVNPTPRTWISKSDDLLDCFDFPKVCCTKACSQNIEQIWSDLYQIDNTIWKEAMEEAFSVRDSQFDHATDEVGLFPDEEPVNDLILESIPSHVHNPWDASDEDEELTLPFDFPNSIDFSNNVLL